MRTLQHAIGLAAHGRGHGEAATRRVYACGGSFEEKITLPSGVDLWGGRLCDGGDWSYDGSFGGPDHPTILAPPVGIPLRVLTGGEEGATSTVFGVRVEAADASADDGKSSIAMILSSGARAIVRESVFLAGDGKDGEPEYEAALTLERCSLKALGILMDIAKAAIMSENYGRATEAAERLLADATDHADTFQYGNAVHYAHITLGKVALARNDPTNAAEHLRAAGEVRGSPQLDTFGPNFELASRLLSMGQRDAVVDYIDGCKKFWKSGAARLDQWTLAIERGETPDFSKRWTT